MSPVGMYEYYKIQEKRSGIRVRENSCRSRKQIKGVHVMKFCLVAGMAMLIPMAVFGQEFRSTISGSATDSTGSAIVNVKVTATETRTGVKTPTFTDVAGKYALPF